MADQTLPVGWGGDGVGGDRLTRNSSSRRQDTYECAYRDFLLPFISPSVWAMHRIILVFLRRLPADG